MVVKYRQLQAPAQVETNIPGTGSAQTTAALADALSSLSRTAGDITAQIRTREGEEEGAIAGGREGFGGPDTSKGGFRRGWKKLTAYSQAYNNAALRSYAVRAEADAEDQQARLQAAANGDPNKFEALYGAVRDEVLKTAPREAVAVLNEIYTKRLGAGVSTLRTAQLTELRNKARTDFAEHVDRATNHIAQLRAEDTPEAFVQAEEEQTKLDMFIGSAQQDGTVTAVEAVSAQSNTQKAITAETVIARFRRELDSPYGDPIAFIRRLKEANKTSEALPPKDEEKLLNQIMGELAESNSLDAADAARRRGSIKTAFEEGEREATSLLLTGRLTQRKLNDMVVEQRLDPGVARSLLNELQEGDSGADDPRVAFDVRTNLLRYTEEEISKMPGLRWSTRADLLLKRREEAAGWKGTQAAREGENRILGIARSTMPMGFLSDDEKARRNQALIAWYNEVDKLPPAEREQNVIPLAEEAVSRYIRKTAATKAQAKQRTREAFLRAAGPVDQMSDDKRKKFEEQLRRIDDDIARLEAEAARK